MTNQILEIRMKIQPLQSRLKSGQKTDGKTNPARAVEHIDAATDAFHGASEIERAAFDEAGPIIRADDFARPGAAAFGSDGVGQRPLISPHPQDGCEARLDMQIARSFRFGEGDKSVKIHQIPG